jgi:outer membrane protein
MATILKKKSIFSFISVLLILSLHTAVFAYEKYSLDDLYKLALVRSEKIKISELDVHVAEMMKKKALSVLVPRFSLFGDYTRYYEDRKLLGGDLYEWTSSRGVRFDQSFTLNGKELIAFKITKHGIQKAKQDLMAVQEVYLFDVASSYYDTLKALKAVEITRANVIRLREHERSVRTRLTLGEVLKTVLIRALAELSTAKTELITAKNRVMLTHAVLASVVGLPQGFETLEPDPENEKSFFLKKLDAIKSAALSNRAELKSLNILKTIATEEVSFYRSDYWPSLSVEGVYLNSEYKDAPDYEENLYAAVSVSIPLFDGGLRNAEIKEALFRKKQVELAVNAMRKQILIEVEQAYLKIITQQNILKSLGAKFQFARENFYAVEKQFKYGLASSLDVMDANTLLVTSQEELSNARYSLKLAILELKRAQGTFLSEMNNLIVQ